MNPMMIQLMMDKINSLRNNMGKFLSKKQLARMEYMKWLQEYIQSEQQKQTDIRIKTPYKGGVL